MAATYESVAKEFPDLPQKRIEKIVEWRNSAPQREEESARKIAEDKARAERQHQARAAAHREQAIKKAEAGKDELAKLRAQQYKAINGKLTPEQQQHNKELQTKINAEKKRREELHEKSLRANYDKRKAELEEKYPSMKQFGVASRIAATPIGKFDARGIEGHLKDSELYAKFAREDELKRTAKIQQQILDARAAGKPLTPATTATTATPVTPRPAVGSNGMNAMASTITSSAPFKKGGKVAAKKYAKGGKVSSAPKTAKASTASRRGDGIAQRGKTRGRML